jgi:hypothetical protein
MTKPKLLTLALTCLLWNLNSNAELKVRFANDVAADKASLKPSLEKTANDFWFAEEQYWKVVPADHELEIDFSLVSTDHVAQTRQNRINFNVYTAPKDMGVTLKHEVAHVFFNRYCPGLTDPFAQELFAYWRSDDYLRLLYGQKQLFAKADAFRELKQNSPFGNSKAISVARLINELVKKDQEAELKNWFTDVFKQCQDSAFLKKQFALAGEFINRLQGNQVNQSNTNDYGFLVFDSLANESLYSEGNWQKKQTVGSTLKPLAVSFFKDIKTVKAPKKTVEWECGKSAQPKWDYKKALNYSCNGFFLDTKMKPGEMSSYTHTLNALTNSSYQPEWLNMADAIGLWPTIQLDLLDLAKVYDYILETNPNTISILKQTPIAGTLSESKEADWFIQHGISLKSGTTTQLDLSIEKGFLVAVFNTGSAPKIAVLYRAGNRPIDLLPELKAKIEKYISYVDSPAQVQVLSSFQLNSVDVSCPTILLKNGAATSTVGKLDLQNMKSAKTRLGCAGAPFEVSAKDQISRKLYGDLTFRSGTANAPLDQARSEKNARARRGSELVLHTSEWHYLRSVYFSESGNYRQELKKAMLLVFKNNLTFWKSKKEPICDTTICQVFNLHYEQIKPDQKKQVDDLILEIGSSHLGAKNWLEFSLGGTDEWTQSVTLKNISEYLKTAVPADLSGTKTGDEFTFDANGQKISVSCEKLRTYFKLRSCPDAITSLNTENAEFKGRGEGHERGMDLTVANQLAIQGFNFDQIIEAFYKLKILK